ncbi:hypothetical protein E4A48_01255 [Xanthomonas cerealis pv. cerealis]|uniref:Uncharacterized protein n=1 Tax=Xanthomonas cerealis pv. cerealis TaxID=152263 RepID=A0A514E8Z7_9XANT|nr:hypothetical protein [Xanthomonas translucens]QDI02508.1 hypothetical protein E4A48_01255 [Xanthomonas translucens pv. cerealis]
MERFAALTNTIVSVLRKPKARMEALMPEMLEKRIDGLIGGMGTLRTTAEQMSPRRYPVPSVAFTDQGAAYDYAKHWMATCYVSSTGSVSAA